MADQLTPRQALLVWCLLAKQGGAWQADILPTVAAADRKALERMRLLSARKIKGYGGALWLELDDDEGWAWAAAHLDAELPPNHRGFSDLLVRLKHHLGKAKESLAEVIGAGPGAPPPKDAARTSKATPPTTTGKAAKPKTASEPATPKKAATSKVGRKTTKRKETKKPPTAVEARAAIEAAYLAVTGNRKGVDAKLSDIRAKLDLPRAAIDAALDAIQRGDPKVRLMRMDDRRSITPADEKAAFVAAGDAFHVLWIMP